MTSKRTPPVRVHDLLNAMEFVARSEDGTQSERSILLLKLELLRQHRLESERRAEYHALQVESCDSEMAKLNEKLEALDAGE